jgi:hypothetical protein
MKWKKIWLSSLAVALLGLGVVRGQGFDDFSSPPSLAAPPATALGMPNALPASPGEPAVPPPGQQVRLSNWILGERCPGCCGPIGGNGPIGSEMYLRSGVSIPIGGGALNSSLETGWDIEGGARVLFFNRAVDAAWTVDISVTNIFNPPDSNPRHVTLTNVPLQTAGVTGAQTTVVPSLTVTPSDLNRTYVNISAGREIWLLGTADSSHNDLNWRIGWDVGGRWGTEDLELQELEHRTCALGGVFFSAHSDVEVPCGSWILEAGFRVEWGYTFGDILQRTNDGNTMDLNLMFTLGVRF